MSNYCHYTLRMISSKEKLDTIVSRLLSGFDKDRSDKLKSINLRRQDKDNTYVLFIDYLCIGPFYDYKKYIEEELKIDDVYFCLSCVSDTSCGSEYVLYDEENRFFKKTYCELLLVSEFSSYDDYFETMKKNNNYIISKDLFDDILKDRIDFNILGRRLCYTDLYYLEYDKSQSVYDITLFNILYSDS